MARNALRTAALQQRGRWMVIAVSIGVATGAGGCANSGSTAGSSGGSSSADQSAPAPPRPQPPVELRLTAPSDGRQTYADSILVNGIATAGASVTVNGDTAKVSSPEGRTEHFRARVPLEIGHNNIDVEANLAGRDPGSTTVVVTRKKRPAVVGSILTLRGQTDDVVKMKLLSVTDPVSGGQFDTPPAGKRYVGLEVSVTNVGSTPFSDAVGNGATLVTDSDHQADTTILSDGPCGGSFQSDLKLAPGETRVGCIPFEVTRSETPKLFEWTPDSGYGHDTGRWHLTG